MSGANVKIWAWSSNISDAPQGTYNIKLDGIIIPDLSPYALYGAGISIKANDNGFQIIISNNAGAYRYWQGGYYSQWFIWFQH